MLLQTSQLMNDITKSELLMLMGIIMRKLGTDSIVVNDREIREFSNSVKNCMAFYTKQGQFHIDIISKDEAMDMKEKLH